MSPIRKPPKPPTNGGAPDKPDAPRVGPPEQPQSPQDTTDRLGSYGNASIDQHDPLFIAAAEAVQRKKGVRVDPRFLKAMMEVESGGDGNYPPSRCRPADSYDRVPACGPMQIKQKYHQQRCPECDFRTLAGQIELACHIIGDTMRERGTDEAGALLAVYFPGADANGTTQAAYLARVRKLVATMEADAGEPGEPDEPEPTRPLDPLSAILGGRPVPRIAYGWLADAGLDYYAYGVNHGTQRSTQHPAIDIPLPCGAPLHTPAAGVVDCVGTTGTPRWGQACGAYADRGGGVGNVTILLDGGVKLTLGHCREAFVRPGQRVTAGQRVATVGDFNGCHVHVECSVERNGTYWLVEPVAALRGVMGGRVEPDGPPAGYREVAVAGLPAPILLPADIRFRQQLTPIGPNRPGVLLDWRGIVQHETGNPRRGADAAMHADWQANGTPGHPDGKVGVHFYVDDKEVVQTIPVNERGIHAGDTRNGTTVGIELTVNADRDAARAERNAQELVAALLRARGWSARERLAPHRQGSGCPAVINGRGGWPAWVEAVERRVGGGGVPPEPAEPDEPLPDALLRALFPAADLGRRGIVTTKWLECRERDKAHYPFIRSAEDGAGKLWIFSGLVLRSEGGAVVEVAPAGATTEATG